MKLPHIETPPPPRGPNWATWLVAGVLAIVALSVFVIIYRYAAGYAYR
jgi:hypothetical protein